MSNEQPTHSPPSKLGDEVPATAASLAEAFSRDPQNPAVCVVDGWGLRVRVTRGHLEIEDGLGRHRRQRRYARATHGLARLVIIGATGMISLEALGWCAGAGVGVVVIDPADASVLATSGACAVDDGRIRRAQALAPGTETGMAIARYLVGVKLAGQAEVAALELANPTAAETITRLGGQLADAASLEEIRQFEAAAANLYWQAWEGITLEFIRRDEDKVPSHWRGFEGRRSAVNPGTPRNATDPSNALCNLCYRLVEAEGRLATMSLGLDPGLGILHADMRNRDGFVLDLIESCRPIADRHIARLIKGHTFRRMDFGEDARGVVRVLAPLSHHLAGAMPSFGAALAPYAEHVAALLGAASPYDMNIPSVLTKVKHKEAARRRAGLYGGTRGTGPSVGGIGPRKKVRQRPEVNPQGNLPLPLCRICGGNIPPEGDRDLPRGRYCESCLVERRRELGAGIHAASRVHGDIYAVQEGVRPTHTGNARVRRQSANALQRTMQREWEAAHKGAEFDPEWFRENVLPGLADLSLTTIAKATGMSTSAASRVRSGQRVPHPRHWEALQAIVGH